MDWTYAAQLAVSVLIFAPGLIVLAVFLVLDPLLGRKRSESPEEEEEPEPWRADEASPAATPDHLVGHRT